MKLIYSISHIKSSIELNFSKKIHIILIGKVINVINRASKYSRSSLCLSKNHSKSKRKSNIVCYLIDNKIRIPVKISTSRAFNDTTLARPVNSIIIK